MSQMLKSSGSMALATMVSRVLGLIREILYARFMGVTWVAGAFQMAYLIPGLFRRLLGEGALTAAFIPLFKEKEKLEGDAEMWRAANAVVSGLIVVTSAISGLVLLGVSIALAFWSFSPETDLMLRLLRWMFPYLILVCLAAIGMGMLNSRGYFFIPAAGAAMLNVVMIAAVLFLAPRMGNRLEEQVFGLAIGVLVAGVAQALFQLPPLQKEGFKMRWVRPWQNDTVRKVVQRMIAGILGVAALQINLLVTQSMAFAFDSEIVASFSYAVRLMELPQGVFGISLATYLLPTLAGLAAEKNFPEFRRTLGEGLDYIVFLNMLASVLLVLLATPIIRLLLQGGAFGEAATHQVAFALKCLAPGLLAFSMVNILARAFYALGDTRTPMLISTVCLGLNVIFTLGLLPSFAQGGLGLANTISSCFNVWLLFRALRLKLSKLDLTDFWAQFWKIGAAGLLAGAVAWGTNHGWENRMGHETFMTKLGAVFVPMIAAAGLYWSLLFLLKVPAARALVGRKHRESEEEG